MLMPGETAGPENGPYLSYLRALASWDRRFPGFGHDTHGVEPRHGTYFVQCLKNVARERPQRGRIEEPEELLVGGMA